MRAKARDLGVGVSLSGPGARFAEATAFLWIGTE